MFGSRLVRGACLLLLYAPSARALETQVSTGIYYYPSEAEKLMRAQTESAEDGLAFPAPRDPREVARDLADEELRDGNVCLREARRDLRAALRKWRVRELCDRIFRDPAENALRDAQRERLHPDHFECDAAVEAREAGGELKVQLVFRGQLVMRDRAPVKLRHAGIGGELTRWELPQEEGTLGTVSGSWKEALRAGACTADQAALDMFWKRIQDRAAQARELAECRNADGAAAAEVARLQKQLHGYVPEEWVTESGGEEAHVLLEAPAELARGATLAECRKARSALGDRLERLRALSSRIAGRHDVPALDPQRPTGRAPASVSQDEDDGE